jgi:hypothetical protein
MQDLPPKPEKGREGCIDYALACKELGRYDDGLDVLNPIIHTGELAPENWKAYALAGFFNLQRGETAVCRKLMKQAVTAIGGDRIFYNCMRDSSVYNHFAYHFDFQHMQDVHDFLLKRKMARAYLQEVTVSSEGILFISETIGRKIIALDLMGNFLWGKSLNLRKKVESSGPLSDNILMSSGYGEGVTLVDNASGDVIQMDKEGSFKSMAPLGNRFFRINSFTQDYFGCIFVTEDNSMRLSIFEPDGKLQREIYLDEVMDYNSEVNPFTIIYDEEGFLHLYNIDVLLTLNGEGRKIFRKDLLTSGKAREDYKKITKGIACDSSGRIYVVRPSENRIQVIDKTHGTELGSFGPDIANTKLVRPIDVAIDLDENIYINDSGNARILKVDTSTGDVTTLFHQKHWKYLPVTR